MSGSGQGPTTRYSYSHKGLLLYTAAGDEGGADRPIFMTRFSIETHAFSAKADNLCDWQRGPRIRRTEQVTRSGRPDQELFRACGSPRRACFEDESMAHLI